MAKERLDVLVQRLHPEYTRTVIQSLIMQGKVKVEGKVVTKAGTAVSIDSHIELDQYTPKYVSRAGYKLEKALEHFGINVDRLIALDAGLSTGGFTDCLLQNGAAKVYGIDVGYGQVDQKIRSDVRVVVTERTNLRHMPPLDQKVDIITLDLSFISVLKVMEVVTKNLKTGGTLIVLIKPQFEAVRKDIGKGGVIKDPQVHERVVKTVVGGIVAYGFELKGVIESPILGATGNKEFLGCFVKDVSSDNSNDTF